MNRGIPPAMHRARVSVRLARLDDCTAIARAHVRAWQVAYRSVMPDAYLAALRVEDREARWRTILANTSSSNWTAVVTLDEVVVGFCTVGDSRDEASMSELWGINVDPDAFATGAGQALIEATHDELDRRPQATSMLWVVRENARARRFYERNGWRQDSASKEQEFGGRAVTELRYLRDARPERSAR